MDAGLNILSITIFLPVLGALFIAFFVRGEPAARRRNARNTALFVTIGTFIFSLLLLYQFDPAISEFQFVEKYHWIEGYHIYYHLGIDGISLFFILLTTLLMPVCILCSWRSIGERIKEYMISFLLLEAIIIGAFSALDLVLFYLFFEAVLIPMFLIIGIWGGEHKVYASFKFFLYTLAGSIVMLIMVLYVYHVFGSTDIPLLTQQMGQLPLSVQRWLWLALFASFAVKIPMWPIHTWLPDAHVQAPTAGSVILAGVLLKLGGYGFLRLSLPMLPEASIYFAPFMFVLSVIAIVYTSFIALRQEDMKKLVAYSSIAHMGFVTLGIFTFNKQGLEGSIVVMISHGLVSAALFLCVGILYDRLHTKAIDKYGGVVEKMPGFALCFMIFTMASIGLPGTSGFVGELLVMVGVFQVNKVITAVAATGVVLSAAYMLWLYARVMFGPVKNIHVAQMPALTMEEKIVLWPLVAFILFIGIYPVAMTQYISTSVDRILSHVTVNVVDTLPGH